MAALATKSAKDASSNQRRDPSSGKEPGSSSAGGSMVSVADLSDPDLLLPSVLPFKRTQLTDRYPKGHSRGRHWKHLKQIIQAENYHLHPADEPSYVSIEAPPSMYPAKKYCDITGFEAPYTDPRTKLRYSNAEVFKKIRFLPDEQIQGYLSLRNAAVVLK
ncbi:protein EIN6 ENHANCER isoform X1 [Physcomitrium patens]|uniref:Vps72/YL1 C-terminal domain-containing protein n=2 Tax=Physcomitrium patens TaxID=3218 RepID=A0A2K1JHA4_PHYPA|nr:chromatin-remodeling complex subunit ies6-like isoform X1 [Physcomitrium patens]PNR40922.1 hypothetical protein PHYPA_018325 [Physcomitrium patens]|eukprot:XP_024393955.1 chromatin-remodeling complex subunit ies6-like isoform X1 [Physcomitrella patens]